MTENNPVTISQIKAILSRIEGLTCWNIRWRYGGTLDFDIGEKVIFSRKELGEWWLTVDTNHFTITKSDGSVFDTRNLDAHFYEHKAQVHEQLSVLLDKFIAHATFDEMTFGVAITMKDSTTLTVIPTPADDEIIVSEYDDEPFELPYWSLFMPNKSSLEVGPSGKLRIKQSN